MNPLQAGVVCFERMRLERPLPSDADYQVWLATDLRTDSLHAVEFLPTVPSAGEEFIHAPHASLLSFYRLEVVDSTIAAVTAFHRLLETPSLRTLAAAPVEPSTAAEWFLAIADAVRVLHESGHRAHGAI